MRNNFFILLNVLTVISLSCVQQVYMQNKPLTMDEIILALRTISSASGGLNESVNKTLADEINQKGVDFALDTEKERILLQNGANNLLILAIKKSIKEGKSPALKNNTSVQNPESSKKLKESAEYLARAKTCNKYDEDCKINNYNRAIELDPKNASLYLLRANSHSAKNNYEEAIADYTKAIEIEPNLYDAYLSRAFIYNLRGKYEKAIADYTKYLELKPTDDLIYSYRAAIYGVHLADYEKATSDLSKAIEIKPDSSHYYGKRADFYRYAGKCKEAIADYSKVIETHSVKRVPMIELDYLDRGDCYTKIGEYEKAIADYTKAIEINTTLFSAYGKRAEVYEIIGKLDKAASDRKKYDELINKISNNR